jgi:hypothetical protein
MADTCGLKSCHVLEGSLSKAVEKGYNFFADSPFYVPNFLHGVLSCAIFDEIRFIYVNKSKHSWLESVSRLRNDWAWNCANINYPCLQDQLCYEYVLTDLNKRQSKHRTQIERICKEHRIDLLTYNFYQGWEPFCNFIGSEIPKDTDVPWIKDY